METSIAQRDLGAMNRTPTIIDAQNKYGSVIRMEANSELNGFVIQNGKAEGNPQKNGGGIWADDNAIVANCVIINNYAAVNGGGLYAKGVTKIINSTIENNSAKGSGGNMFGNCTVIKTDGKLLGSGTPPIPAIVPTCNATALTFELGTPSFVSSQTWKVGDQEWSDAVTAPGCIKGNTTNNNAYANNATISDCRQAVNGFKGHYFSWCMVMRFANQLCPGDWRVPSMDDLIALDQALGGNGNIYQQNTSVRPTAHGPASGTGLACQGPGGTWGGHRFTAEASDLTGAASFYWSSSDAGSTAPSLVFNATYIYPVNGYPKNYGFALRCVK
jgi:uncharacterized protein (TIGR02145 family)